MADIARVVVFLRERNPSAAKRLRDSIYASFEAIRATPGIGRRRHDAPAGVEVRERVRRFGRSAYIIRYVVEPGTVVILRIHHGRENRA